MNYKTDYYKILGIRVDADKVTVKKAYKRLALQYHPDINKSSNAERKFKRINEAYTVLSDDEKRSKYDRVRAKEFMKKRSKNQIDTYDKSEAVRYSINYIKRERKSRNTISKGIKIASNLEKDYGLFSGLLGLNKKEYSSKSGRKSGKSSQSSGIISSLLNTTIKSSKKGQHRHRHGHGYY